MKDRSWITCRFLVFSAGCHFLRWRILEEGGHILRGRVRFWANGEFEMPLRHPGGDKIRQLEIWVWRLDAKYGLVVFACGQIVV